MAYTVKCYHCKMPLYTLTRIKFPLDYRTFVPATDAVDRVYDEPMCPFCERLFQIVPHDISMKKLAMAPLLTDKGIMEPGMEEERVVTSETPKCKCGCGEEVKKKGLYVSRVHKAKHYAQRKTA